MANTVILILGSLFFSAFFSGMEIGFVSSNRIRLELDKKRDSLSARILNLFYSHPEQFISTMLVGNNIALVIYGIGMANFLYPFLASVWDNELFIVVAQTLFSTLLILITGEFLPKTIFRINPNFALRIFSVPLSVIYFILYPISKFSAVLSKGVLRLVGVRLPERSESGLVSKVDLDFFIKQRMDAAPEDTGVESEIKLFRNVLDFSNVKLRDCMVPRAEVVAVDIDTTDRETLISTFIETGRSKILVYRGQIDDVAGYIHSSEMFIHPDKWKTRIKPIGIYPESMSAPKLMKELMLHKKSMAVVVDEFGGTAGIVTLEDLVEEIFGDIEDEHDTMQYVARRIEEDEYELSGRLEIAQLNELFDLGFPESDDYQTVAGYILFYYRAIPASGETLVIDRYTFKILKISVTKIELVRMKIAK